MMEKTLYLEGEGGHAMEHQDQLFPGGPRFYYDDSHFPPGTDTFLLGAFPSLRPGERVCDLGCGCGLLGLLLLAREASLHITGVELQPEAAALAEKTAAANGLEDRLVCLRADLRDASQLPPAGSFDLCVANPPYFPVGSGAPASGDARRSARSEETATLEQVCAAAARLLRWGGRFALCFRPDRLTDLLCTLRQQGLEPKRLRLVEARAGRVPSLVLAEARRGGRPGLRLEAPLILTGADGRPTADYNAAYFRHTEDKP